MKLTEAQIMKEFQRDKRQPELALEESERSHQLRTNTYPNSPLKAKTYEEYMELIRGNYKAEEQEYEALRMKRIKEQEREFRANDDPNVD